MRLVENNVTEIPIKKIKPMYCFGGCNVSIELDKIDSIERLYWDSDDEHIPVLMFTLKDGTKISVDYDNEQDAKEALNCYKKEFIKVL